MTFLRGLRENNSRDWMLAHKDLQREATGEFEELLDALICDLAVHDPSVLGLRPRDLTYRLNRDTRFSADKSPYHPAFRAHISPGGKAPVPGKYYLYIAPGGTFLGGGVHAAPFPDAVERIRTYIAAHGQAFEDIVTAPEFTKNFVLVGEKLKNVPKNFDPAHPQGQYLKHKSWDIECRLPDEALDDLDAFRALAVEKYLLMVPFNDYLNKAVEGFVMPQR